MGSKDIIKKSKNNLTKYRGPECLNCGHPLDLTDKFCSNCSQRNTTKQLSMNDFFQEFFSSMFTYDSRLRFTIKDLLFKPGTITRNYVDGQRLKYANPFRFFLSVSIIYFIIQGLTTSFGINNESSGFQVNGETIKTTSNLDSLLNKIPEREEIKFEADALKEKLDSINQTNTENAFDTEKESDTIPNYLSEAELDTIQWSNRIVERFFVYRKYYKNTKIKDSETALENLNHPKTRLNRWIYNKNDAIDRVTDNPFGFANYLMSKIPFFLFFFAPFFAFFFWILYSMKKYNYMEHLIFIFHIFSFVFLLVLLCFIPDLIIGDTIFAAIALTFIGPFYFYKALRNFYKQKRFITILKFILLNIAFFVGSMITALIFFSISAAIY